MQTKEFDAIGDATNNEERLLQDRIVRILSYTTEASDLVFLYFNNQYPDDPPSYSLFDDDSISDALEQHLSDAIKTKGCHDMLPKLVNSKVVDCRQNNSYQIEDIVTRIYLPSEEFAQVVELGSLKRLCSRMWSWCKSKAGCK